MNEMNIPTQLSRCRLELRRNIKFRKSGMITLFRVKLLKGLRKTITPRQPEGVAFCVGNELSSRLVSKQVFLPLQSLTSVFGMGTGGPSALESPTYHSPCGSRYCVSAMSYLSGSSPSKYFRHCRA